MSFHTDSTSRRSFLRVGSSILALPFLESFASAKGAKTVAATPPMRMIFLGGGFGFTKDTFYPKKAGRFEEIGMTEGLAPLARHKDDFTMVSNLTNLGASDPTAAPHPTSPEPTSPAPPASAFTIPFPATKSPPRASEKTPASPPSFSPPRSKTAAKTLATEKASPSPGTRTATPSPASTSPSNSTTNSSPIPATPVPSSMPASRKSSPSSTSSASMAPA